MDIVDADLALCTNFSAWPQICLTHHCEPTWCHRIWSWPWRALSACPWTSLITMDVSNNLDSQLTLTAIPSLALLPSVGVKWRCTLASQTPAHCVIVLISSLHPNLYVRVDIPWIYLLHEQDKPKLCAKKELDEIDIHMPEGEKENLWYASDIIFALEGNSQMTCPMKFLCCTSSIMLPPLWLAGSW